MSKVKRRNVSNENNRISSGNVSTTSFNSRIDRNKDSDFTPNIKGFRKRYNDDKEIQTNELGEAIFPISYKRRITVRKWQGNVLVDIREHYLKEDLLLPSKKGISLTLDQYKQLRKHIM